MPSGVQAGEPGAGGGPAGCRTSRPAAGRAPPGTTPRSPLLSLEEEALQRPRARHVAQPRQRLLLDLPDPLPGDPEQGAEIRVQAPAKDELQAVIGFLREQDFGVELRFGNYRG